MNYHPISSRVDGSMSCDSPYYHVDIDFTSSSSSRTIGQGSSILSSVKHVMTHTCLKTTAISAANSKEWLESFSNWRKVGVISQLASATMIEFLPLPVNGNPNIFSTGNKYRYRYIGTGNSRDISEIEINSYPDSIKLIRKR